MRINCPFCGQRVVEEYVYLGDAKLTRRPEGGSDHDHVYLRDNPTGRHRELWRHEGGCGAWLVVERDVTSHRIFSVMLADRGQNAN
ncbi:MAG: sarcosine oxidase subunit delta [Paracoccaceae bacterium]